MAEFAEILERFKTAIEQCDTDTFKSLFTEDAVYHDTVYGTFRGHAELERLLRDVFHEDATDFRWEMVDPVCNGEKGYAVYRFSLKPSHPNAAAGRSLLEGCAQFTLKDGRIAEYKEWANVAGTLMQSGVPDNVVLRFLKREVKKLRDDPNFANHLE